MILSLLVLLILAIITLVPLIQSFDYNKLNFVESPENIIIEQSMLDLWNSRYKSDVKEYIYCLYGETYDDGYVVTNIKETIVTDSSHEMIKHYQCDGGNLIGTIHSHPQPNIPGSYSTCDLSKRDIYTFGYTKNALSGVICGEDKLAFYSTKDFEIPLEVMVK